MADGRLDPDPAGEPGTSATSGTSAGPTDAASDPDLGGGIEGPRGHEADGRVDDRTVPLRMFLVMGGGLAVIAAIYASTAYERAGTTMTTLAAALALWCGAYLWLQQRPRHVAETVAAAEDDEAAGAEEEYLPHASVWPFAIGLGVATLANGLVLGIWVAVPGLGILALGIGGWILQTRRRD
jgi:hypothetical protein